MEFRLLGPLEVLDDDGVPIPLGGRRPRALLAMLLLRPNETVSTDRLIDGIWGESTPASGQGALQVHVHALRRAIGADRILTRSPGYLVRVGVEELDVERFERLAASSDPDELRAALALWRGPALADVAYEPFAQAEAARLDESRLAALEARIAADLEHGRHSALVAEVDGLAAAHPHRERLQAHRILALYRCGRQADALAAYREARDALDELGLEPSPELRSLERRILEHDPALLPGRRAVAIPAAEPLPELIGRDLELVAVGALLDRTDVRIVTLTGPGGTGKTALARAAAHSHGAHVFVDLAPLTDPSLVLATIAAACDVDEDPNQTVLDALVKAFESTPPLLLLDNLEHLAPAFPDVARLLTAAPALRILATSRVPLRIGPEHEYRVSPLAVPALDVSAVDELARIAAVQLYLDRARAAIPDFELLDENAQAVSRVCRALDGLPLAIELAAARIRVLGPEGTAKRLGESLALLTRHAPDLPERQRSLRATIDWSYDLLDPPEQAAFRTLSIFPAGATFEALEATSDEADELPDSLERLLDAGLVRSRATPSGEPRFSMLETIRAYAATLLDESSETTLRDRQLAYHLRVVRGAHAARRTDPPAYARLVTEEDRDNFRAALAYAASAGRGDELLELAASLAEFWRTSGALDEGRHWLEESLALAPEGDPRLRGRVLFGLALLGYVRGQPEAAYETVGRAIELLEAHGQREELGRAIWLRGAAAHGTSDYAVAVESYELAIALLREAGYEATAGRVVGSLAEARRQVGDLDGAVVAARESVTIAEHAGDEEAQAYALAHAGYYDLLRGDRAAAAREIVAALEVASRGGGRWATAIALLYAAPVALAYDRSADAAVLLGAAHTAFDAVGEDRWSRERNSWEPTLAALRGPLDAELEELLDRGRGLAADEAVGLAVRAASAP
jgi:predicted ATPase/DNA-binding SARP family transcriptional activator